MSLNALRRVLSHSGWSAAALHARELLSGALSVELFSCSAIPASCLCLLQKVQHFRMLSLMLVHSLGSL